MVEEDASATRSLFLPLANGGQVSPTPPAITVAVPTPAPLPTPAFPLYTGPPLNRADIGVQIHLHREDVGGILHHLRRLGAGWVKVQVSWKLYQPYPDQYSAERFAELDSLVDAAVSQEISVLLSVSKAPEWSRPTTEMDGPPSDFDLYREFMGFLAGRYQGRVGAYELWNEPNLQREWNGFVLDAEEFASLVSLGADGVRAVDPQATLISGALATTGINDGVIAIDDRVYFSDMILSGIADSIDVIGAHPYGWANPPDSSVTSPDPQVPSHNDHPSFFFKDTLVAYSEILAAQGLDKQIWVTEFGWGSFDGFGYQPPDGAIFMTGVTQWQQATYILRAFELAHGWDWVGPMMLWNLNFGPLLGEQFSESGYSLLGLDGAPRPAYLALEAAHKQ